MTRSISHTNTFLSHTQGYALATTAGLVAIFIWAGTVVMIRAVSELMGPWWAGGLASLIAGLCGIFPLLSKRGFASLRQVPKGYMYGAGTFFIFYMVFFYLGLGWSVSRQQAIELGMVNYLWPSLTLIFSLFILSRRANYRLWLGMAIAFGGIIFINVMSEHFDFRMVTTNIASDGLVYILTFGAATAWALYSTLTKKYGEKLSINIVPLFFLISSIPLIIGGFLSNDQIVLSFTGLIELLMLALLVHLAANSFWDLSMRRGDLTLVTACSYVIPVLSIIFGAMYFDLTLGLPLLVGSILIGIGALLCKLGVSENPSIQTTNIPPQP
ncbi:aromatic amino acid DMT transporter YddG [Poriferisphaera sp. WC338]|uniref:aromatic amino acid DMT transporter YddG n=1 Tax=Poriferisphaera sp. WC338 TaxID=3425129 RepID=UPI003D818A29